MRDNDKSEPDSTVPEQTMAVMVVDTKSFSKHEDQRQSLMQVFIPDVLAQAFQKSNLESLWTSCYFQDGTGDGYLIGFKESYLPIVVGRFFDALQLELRLEAVNGLDMRMRLALHVGPVPVLTDPRLDSPVGKTMIDTCRLVGSSPARALLEYSDPAVTRLSVLVTDAVMDWTMRRGASGIHHASEYVPVDVAIPDKGFATRAFAHVPAPSGEVLAHGLAGVQELAERAGEEEPLGPDPAPDGHITGDRNKTYRSTGDVSDQSVSVGDISGSAGPIGRFDNAGDVAGRDIVKDSAVHHARRDIVNNHAARDINQPRGDVNNGRDSGRREPWRFDESQGES